jgi:AraC family transcriptional regulator
MTITRKVIWQIESRLAQPISLATLSDLCGVSPYHLSRTFSTAIGMSPMAYARARRLSLAATRLADGEDILSVALEAQYGSHEAFTRAFVSQFGLLPNVVRKSGSVQNLTLQEALKMDNSKTVDLDAPRFETRDSFHVVGMTVTCKFGHPEAIPGLWDQFNAREDDVDAIANTPAYGVCHASDQDGCFDYTAGRQTDKNAAVPDGMQKISIPAGKYAVFVHKGHIADFGDTVQTVWNTALAEHNLTTRQAPDFELYDSRFNPETGRGEVEIWIPVAG